MTPQNLDGTHQSLGIVLLTPRAVQKVMGADRGVDSGGIAFQQSLFRCVSSFVANVISRLRWSQELNYSDLRWVLSPKTRQEKNFGANQE
jgi:hypothetical protein